MPTPREPKAQRDLAGLWPPFRAKVELLLAALRAKHCDPVIVEARRTKERQAWLYGVGRTHHIGQRPVTWTMKSRHLVGKAADIISKSKGYDSPQFFAALKREALKLGLRDYRGETDFDADRAHVQWGG